MEQPMGKKAEMLMVLRCNFERSIQASGSRPEHSCKICVAFLVATKPQQVTGALDSNQCHV
eukprot:scaffold878_cov271-Pinguiococcus_pyrenoidosus.AAC.7